MISETKVADIVAGLGNKVDKPKELVAEADDDSGSASAREEGKQSEDSNVEENIDVEEQKSHTSSDVCSAVPESEFDGAAGVCDSGSLNTSVNVCMVRGAGKKTFSVRLEFAVRFRC